MRIIQKETNIGLLREKNEDAAIAITHPQDKDIILLLVADGMGGKEHGEIAANYVTSSIEQWFTKKDVKTLNNTKKIEELLKKYIKKLNTYLIKNYGEDVLGTTLTMAIINKHDTLIVNIGDSRAYIMRKNHLIQITEDDSDVWMYYKYGEVKKDHLRYFSNNNIINACIGICNELCKVSTIIIENDYDMILLLTDGVTDILTDKKILQIIKKSSKKLLLKNLVEESVYVDQKLKVPLSLKRKYLANYATPIHGRDNSTGAIFIKEV